MVPQESRDAVRRSLRTEESCSLHFALVTAAEGPPLPLLQALCCLLQDSSIPRLWTFIIGLRSPPKVESSLLQALVCLHCP